MQNLNEKFVPIGELLSRPMASNTAVAAELAETAARILRSDGVQRLDSAAWRLADALALIANQCPEETQGIDVTTGRGARIKLER